MARTTIRLTVLFVSVWFGELIIASTANAALLTQQGISTTTFQNAFGTAATSLMESAFHNTEFDIDGYVFSRVYSGTGVGFTHLNAYLYQIVLPSNDGDEEENIDPADPGLSNFRIWAYHDIVAGLGFGHGVKSAPFSLTPQAIRITSGGLTNLGGLGIGFITGPSASNTTLISSDGTRVDASFTAPDTAAGLPTRGTLTFGYFALKTDPINVGPVQVTAADGITTFAAMAYVPNPEPGSLLIWTALIVLGSVVVFQSKRNRGMSAFGQAS